MGRSTTERWLRTSLLMMPTFVVGLAVATLLLGLGEGDYAGVRLYYRPLATGRLAFRAIALRSRGGTPAGRPGALELELQDEFGHSQRLHAVADDQGHAIFQGAQEIAPPPWRLQVRAAAAVQARGLIARSPVGASVAQEPYVEVVGPWRLSLALSTGVLAVPFPSELTVHCSPEAVEAPRPTEVRVTLDGGQLGSRNHDKEQLLALDESGAAHSTLRPEEHHVVIHLVVVGGDEVASTSVTLPVVSGAIFATEVADHLRIASAVPRAEAYADLVTADGVWATLRVPLSPDGSLSVALLPLTGAPRPLWAVTSSDFALQAPATVGWPLRDTPPATLDLVKPLVVDGFAAAQHEAAKRGALRRQRALVAAGTLVAVALALGAVYVHLLRRTAGEDLALSRETVAAAVILLACVAAASLALVGWALGGAGLPQLLP